jgi:hypothetical protein
MVVPTAAVTLVVPLLSVMVVAVAAVTSAVVVVKLGMLHQRLVVGDLAVAVLASFLAPIPS